MQGTMKTAVMTGLKELEWEQRPIPVPSKGEVLVRVEHVGICGSDLHYYEQGRSEISRSASRLCWAMRLRAP